MLIHTLKKALTQVNVALTAIFAHRGLVENWVFKGGMVAEMPPNLYGTAYLTTAQQKGRPPHD